MEWHAGTSPGQSDILAATRLHVTVEMTTNLTQPLPLGRKVYVTLKVFNKAGGRGLFLWLYVLNIQFCDHCWSLVALSHALSHATDRISTAV